MTTRSRYTRTAVGFAIAALTLVGGYFAGAALRDTPATETALPQLGNPVPVIRPMATGSVRPTFDGEATLAKVGAETPLAWVQPAIGAEPDSESDPAGSPELTVDPQDVSSTVGTSDSAEASTSLPDAPRGFGIFEPDGSPSADTGEHYEDPCAPVDPATPAPAGCPEGIRSTILALTSVSPLELFPRANPTGRVGEAVTRCDELAAGSSAIVGISSNNPIRSGVMTWWDEASPTIRHEVEFSDSPERLEAFDQLHGSEGFDYTTSNLFQHCMRLDGLTSSHRYAMTATATDGYDSTAITSLTFALADNRTHAPTVVAPYNGDLLVVGWNKPGTTFRTIAYPVGPDDDPWGACQRLRTSGTGVTLPGLAIEAASESTRTLGAAELTAADYPYDPRWNQITSQRFSQLTEGTTYSLCVTRVQYGTAFDINAMRNAEVFVVTVPNRMRPRVTIEQVDAFGARRLDAHITPANMGTDVCQDDARVGGAAGVLDPAVTLCDLSGSNGSLARYARGMDLHVRAGSVSDPVESTVRLDVPLDACAGPCPPRPDEWFTVPLPSVTVGTGICQSPCDPPRRLQSLGSILVRVAFSDGPSAGGPTWDISDARPVDTSGGLVGDTPRWDWSAETLIRPGATPSATVPVVTDRPTTARVDIRDISGGAPCLTAGSASSIEDAALATSHTFELTGLCVGRDYALRIVIVAEDGASVSFGYGPGVEQGWIGGLLQIPGLQSFTRATISWSGLPAGFSVDHLEAVVGDYPTRDEAGGFVGSDWPQSLGGIRSATDCYRQEGNLEQEATVAVQQTVTVSLAIWASDRRDPVDGSCDANPFDRQYRSVQLKGTIALADLTSRLSYYGSLDPVYRVTLTTEPDAEFQVTAVFSFRPFETQP